MGLGGSIPRNKLKINFKMLLFNFKILKPQTSIVDNPLLAIDTTCCVEGPWRAPCQFKKALQERCASSRAWPEDDGVPGGMEENSEIEPNKGSLICKSMIFLPIWLPWYIIANNPPESNGRHFWNNSNNTYCHKCHKAAYADLMFWFKRRERVVFLISKTTLLKPVFSFSNVWCHLMMFRLELCEPLTEKHAK